MRSSMSLFVSLYVVYVCVVCVVYVCYTLFVKSVEGIITIPKEMGRLVIILERQSFLEKNQNA